ncbi:MAG: hypothetical protein V4801_19170 [Burkholderia gladioli]
MKTPSLFEFSDFTLDIKTKFILALLTEPRKFKITRMTAHRQAAACVGTLTAIETTTKWDAPCQQQHALLRRLFIRSQPRKITN